MLQARNRKYWLLWGLLSALAIAYLGFVLLKGEDKQLFMPGPLTGGHHQIGIACDACHQNSFTEPSDLQSACESCHGDLRKKPFDSHPKAKFKDPRNAALLEKIDVLQCITCHTEHRPEMTHKGGYTQPQDFCIHCHADVGENRPSHKGMDFMTCNDAGCHNFHNNRALYTDFLVKHLHDPDLQEKPRVPQRNFAGRLDEIATYPHDRFPVKKLDASAISAQARQAGISGNVRIDNDWLTTAHARSGVNCDACHLEPASDKEAAPVWNNHPDHQACAQCHDFEVKHFQQGKHGMRLKSGLSPMKPALARLPMQADSHSKTLTCTTCHNAHRFDIKQAAVESCLECHADDHSLAYRSSPHYRLWQKEQAGELPEGSGVSCATCHMPRTDMDVSDWMNRVVVMHNQNATLVPNEKMIRPACLNCHGLEFSINALADNKLIENNFNGKPTFQTESLKLAEEDQKRHEEKRNATKE